MNALSAFALALVGTAAPAFASITVTSPTSGATVPTTFTLSATASPCLSQAIVSMGYSLDASSNTTIVYSTSISRSVSVTPGAHVLHVKSWGKQGASCVTHVSLNVTQSVTNVIVSAPLNGASITSPFPVAASGTYCQGQQISAMGYSIDSSTSTIIQYGSVLSSSVTSATGTHILHIKSWGNRGASCVTSLTIGVVGPGTAAPTTSAPIVPSTAIV